MEAVEALREKLRETSELYGSPTILFIGLSPLIYEVLCYELSADELREIDGVPVFVDTISPFEPGEDADICIYTKEWHGSPTDMH